MKVTVYELLGLVKDGKAPKEIKYDTMNYVFRNYDYKEVHGELIDEQSSWLERIDFYKFDEPVEILEEEKKIPEKIECYHQYDECVVKDKFYQDKTGSLVDEIIIDKINEIIDYLKSKGE